jgi:F-type H+/Na+-transporting ATPase subunit beta
MTEMSTAQKSTTADSVTGAGTGRVVRVAGPVVDVEFPADQVPPLFNALTVEVELEAIRKTMTLEIAQHLGDNTVRAIAM